MRSRISDIGLFLSGMLINVIFHYHFGEYGFYPILAPKFAVTVVKRMTALNQMFRRTGIIKYHDYLIFVIILGANFISFILLTYNYNTDLHRDFNRVSRKNGRGVFQSYVSSQIYINDSSLGIIIKDIGSSDSKLHPASHQHLNKYDVINLLSRQTFKPITSTPYKDVFLFSSVGRRSIKNTSIYDVAINIWETSTFNDRRSYCCYLYESGEINKVSINRKSSFLDNNLTSVQVTCKTSAGRNRPAGVTLVYGNDVCPISIHYYIKIKHPTPCTLPFCLAVCAKIAYGTVNPEIIIEWMEYYKYMGVSNVVTFTYDLTPKAMDVLKFYEKEGIAEVLPFDYPSKDSPAHTIGEKVTASWTDEQLTVFDCHDRLREFDFVGILDFDEFLVPRRGTIQELLVSLSKQNPQAASFSFMSEIHATEWGPEANVSKSMIPQFNKHSKPLKDRIKTVHLPRLVESGGITTHGIVPKPGYKSIGALPQQAILKHYRACRKEWIEEGTCHNQTLYKDTKMAKIFMKINDRIAVVKKQILGIT